MNGLANLDYEERGAGPVVALVHAGVFSAWFEPLFAERALSEFRVIRPIRPGYGSRQVLPGLSIHDQAHACGMLLRQLGARGAHWVGHSSSCCIGLQLALEEPDLVGSLTLFEPAKPSGALRAANASTYVAPAVAAAGRGDLPTAFAVFLRGVGGDRYRDAFLSRLGEEELATALAESSYFFSDEMPALGAWSFGADEARSISVPVLLLTGTDTRPWFGENVSLLAEMLPDARVLTLPCIDHLAPLTHPAQLAVTIADFVRHTAAA
jgi:pimeloyl-ACP methyl ester carboxylesterase